MGQDVSLTPTEELVLEVLAARYRLGEIQWTFASRFKHVVRSLEEKRLVVHAYGMVPDTVRASLTEQGKRLVISDSYVPPAGNLRFDIVQVQLCECGTVTHQVVWKVTGELDRFHHGHWPGNLTAAEREALHESIRQTGT